MNNEVGIEIEFDTLKIKGDASKLYEALAQAQAEFTPVPKMSTGQIGKDRKFKYASYSTLMRCVRPALSRHGITIFQPLHYREDQAITTTILAGHGAMIQSSFAFMADPNPQEFGRHHTYYRRYQLQAMLGIEGDSDADDLPDVNEKNESVQFADERRLTAIAYERPEAGDGDAVRAKAPKGKVSVDTSNVLADPKTVPSVPLSGSSTKNGKAESSKPSNGSDANQPPAVTPKSINDQLTAAMGELKWKMPELKAFFVEHVDPSGFDKAANLTVEKKQLLFRKMVEVHNVTPF